MTTVAKPVDLIVANVMHDAFEAVQNLNRLMDATKGLRGGDKKRAMPDISLEVARKLLCEIAHEARADVVFKALAAAGAPATRELISDGLQSVRDRQ